MVGSFVSVPAGTFADGYIFKATPDLAGAETNPNSGYWRCDVTDENRLTWSGKVYELFGLPTGTPIERDWAVDRYDEPSKANLERVRKFALSRDFGFILDAEIEPNGEANAGSEYWQSPSSPRIELSPCTG